MRRFWIALISIVLSVVAVIAQECPTLEQAAVGETRAWCGDVQPGQACYGNSVVSAEFTDFVIGDQRLLVPGDRVLLTELAAISTAVEDNRYGVAVIRTTGYAPDNWMPQDVTMVLLGVVTITNMGQEGISIPTLTIPVAAAEGANVRSGPTTDYRILQPLFAGEVLKITGRLQDKSWLRVQLADGQTGWLNAGAVSADTSAVPVVDVDTPAPELLYTPFTAFSLQTGTADSRCNQAWESGLLLQSALDSFVRLQINEQNFTVSGTVFLQSPPDAGLTIFVLDGAVHVGDVTVEEGHQLTVPVANDNNSPSAYDFARMAYLPTEMLPRYTYIGIDLTTIITPVPREDRSPLVDTLVTDPCVLTTGPGGANLRGGPGEAFPIRGVLDFRQTARPIGRAMGSDGIVWWELAQNVWISGAVVVTGGDCVNVPASQRIPNPLPTATPEG